MIDVDRDKYCSSGITSDTNIFFVQKKNFSLNKSTLENLKAKNLN